MEYLPLLVFLTFVGSVFALSVTGLIRLTLERAGKLSPLLGNARRRRQIVFGLAALGLTCIAYGAMIEPYWPEVTYLRLKGPGLQRPVRLVHLSDLHCDTHPRLEPRLPGLIAEQHPDAIFFTGDSINTREGLPILRQFLTALARIAPTFVVMGNWDSWYWSDVHLFEGTGVHELDGEVVRCGELAVGGVAVEHEARLPQVLKSLQKTPFSVLLFHYPDLIYEVAGKTDLYLAGHTHGGQVALPLYGAFITHSKYGKRFESGLFQVQGTSLYVNRGIGMEGGQMPRVRFCARPEITVIEVVP